MPPAARPPSPEESPGPLRALQSEPVGIRPCAPPRWNDDSRLLELDDGGPVDRIRHATHNGSLDLVAGKPSGPRFPAFCFLLSAFRKINRLESHGNADGDELQLGVRVRVSVPLLVNALELAPQLRRIGPRLAVDRELERLPGVAQVVRGAHRGIRRRQLVAAALRE